MMSEAGGMGWITVFVAVAQVATACLAAYWRGRAVAVETKLKQERVAHKAAMEAKITAVRSDPNVPKGTMYVDPNVPKGTMYVLTAPDAWKALA